MVARASVKLAKLILADPPPANFTTDTETHLMIEKTVSFIVDKFRRILTDSNYQLLMVMFLRQPLGLH